MLLITVRASQTIIIGDDLRIHTQTIDDDGRSLCVMIYKQGTIKQRAILKLGSTMQVAYAVNMTVTKISRGREMSAVLGFDAPRSISIRGEWIGKATKTKYTKLRTLSPAQLIIVAENEAQTDLEQVLLDNLKLATSRYLVTRK